MKKIRCIETSGYKLTENREYDLLKEEGGFYFLVNDNGKTVRYNSDFFEEVENNTTVMEAVIPPPPPARTEQDLINSITVVGNNIQFVDFNNNTKVVYQKIRSGERMDASCGIGDTYGLLDTADHVDNVIESLNHHDDLIDLRNALFAKSIQYYIKENPDADRGAYIVSCNLNGVDGENYLTEDYVGVLDSIADVTSKIFENPNSENNIKFWVFYKD